MSGFLIVTALGALAVACVGDVVAHESPRAYWWGVLFGITITVLCAALFTFLVVDRG